MNAMKKVLAIAAILFVGCTKVDVPTPQPPVTNAELKIASAVGIKLQSPFVTNEVAMNVKSDVAQPVTIRIFDISNRVVSKETVNVSVGDNILKVYTSALPPSAYRIGLFDANGNQLGITDFNKL
jgi:hypothetical protein